MGLPRKLLELSRVLNNRDSVRLFAPLDKSGLRESSEAASVADTLPHVCSDPLAVVQLCLQTLAIQQQEFETQQVLAEFVASIPGDVRSTARQTHQIVPEMISGSTREIIVIGYQVSSDVVIAELHAAAARGVEISIICDRTQTFWPSILATWPAGPPKPRIYCDSEREDSPPYASMHAKALLVDGKDLLITSANFTAYGLSENIEIGVRLKGPPALEARNMFADLIFEGLVTLVT